MAIFNLIQVTEVCLVFTNALISWEKGRKQSNYLYCCHYFYYCWEKEYWYFMSITVHEKNKKTQFLWVYILKDEQRGNVKWRNRESVTNVVQTYLEVNPIKHNRSFTKWPKQKVRKNLKYKTLLWTVLDQMFVFGEGAWALPSLQSSGQPSE